VRDSSDAEAKRGSETSRSEKKVVFMMASTSHEGAVSKLSGEVGRRLGMAD
jgi:hypothetical protein